MTQAERRLYLIRSLLNEKTKYQSLNVPRDAGEQRKLLRSLMNVRMPKVADEAFLRVQDEYLQQELGHHVPQVRGHRQRREQRYDGLLHPVPRLHR